MAFLNSLTLPDTVCPQPLNPKVQGSTPCASTIMLCAELAVLPAASETCAPTLYKRKRPPTFASVRRCGRHLAFIAEIWRGWMGIEPTQDASTAPRKRF